MSRLPLPLLRTAGSCLVVGALLAGCGSDAEETEPTATAESTATAAATEAGETTAEETETTAAAAPAGYRRVEDAENGYTVLLPERWRDLPFSTATDNLDAFVQENPQMQAQVGALVEQGGLLLALDPDDQGITNMNLIGIPSPGTLDQVVEGGRPQLEAAGATDIERLPASPSGAEVLRFNLPINTPDGGTAVLQQQQYYVQSDTTTYILTLTTDDFAANSEELTTIGDSLELLS